MSDTEVAVETNAKVKGRGRPKKSTKIDGENSTNDSGSQAKSRTSQRKAATIASNALKEQAIGAKRENDEDEPRPKKGRGRPKSSSKKKSEKPKKDGPGRPKKVAKPTPEVETGVPEVNAE